MAKPGKSTRAKPKPLDRGERLKPAKQGGISEEYKIPIRRKQADPGRNG